MALQEQMERQGNWLFRYRSFLPLIIIVIGLGVFIDNKLTPYAFWVEETQWEFPYKIFCLLVSIMGIIIRFLTVGFTPRNTSGRNVDGQLAEQLNTTGIYSTVRHPLYVGNFLMFLGPALLTGSFWFIAFFCVAYWIYYERIMFAEEQFLYRKFGEQYAKWAKSIPTFVPSFKRYRPNHLPFSWRKVVKTEKNGILATMIIFAFFDFLGEWVQDKSDYSLTLQIALGLSVINYIVVKILTKKTTLLDEVGR